MKPLTTDNQQTSPIQTVAVADARKRIT